MDEVEKEFEELIKRLDDIFLDKYVKVRKEIDKNTLEENSHKYIRLSVISRLTKNEEEEAFVIAYLGSIGINVMGNSAYYSGIFDNYKQVKNIEYYKKPDRLSEEEQNRLLKEYQQSRDIEVRNKIVEANMDRVKYFSKCLSIKYGHYDISELESYGNEVLISAVENFDFLKGSFNSYITNRIIYAIMDSINIHNFGSDGKAFVSRLAKKEMIIVLIMNIFLRKNS